MTDNVVTETADDFLPRSGSLLPTPQSLRLEYNRNNLIYTGIIWLVSFWAMMINSATVFFLWVFKNKEGKSFHDVLWNLGRDEKHFGSIFVDRFSSINHVIKVEAASWRALHICYNYRDIIRPSLTNSIPDRLTNYWLDNLMNRQAITNRKKLATEIVVTAIKKFSAEPEINLVSVAAGSAEAVIDAVSLCRNFNVKATLIDLDETALEQARKYAIKNNVVEKFEFHKGTPKSLHKFVKGNVHILEMLGFLDYFDDEKATKLINGLKPFLVDAGIFITGNIKKNKEKILLDWVYLWPMVYRSKQKLAEILISANFKKENIEIIYEPCNIHGIAICSK